MALGLLAIGQVFEGDFILLGRFISPGICFCLLLCEGKALPGCSHGRAPQWCTGNPEKCGERNAKVKIAVHPDPPQNSSNRGVFAARDGGTDCSYGPALTAEPPLKKNENG
ncbi:MAG: hypothetical protein IPK76_22795 [Lewinellaceae bacterium]|nr:hypothetical protein [Lewinellaceae bacterium]